MNKSEEENIRSEFSKVNKELLLVIKEIQGLPDEIVYKFLLTKGALSQDKIEEK